MEKDRARKAKVLCCITTKNAEETIKPLLNSFSNELLEHFDELLIVDNYSADKTIQTAKDFFNSTDKFHHTVVNIFQNNTNYGLGGTHKLTFKYAYDNGHDYIFFVHGDNSTDPNQFLNIFKDDFHKFDMILANRFSASSERTNYPFLRMLFNKLLSTFASLLFFKKIADFSSGGLNLYRVQSFFNKFENPIKYFSNDISFPQYLLLYGIHRRMIFYFSPVNLNEPDRKKFKRLQSQFLKSILLLIKFRFLPRQSISTNTYGTYLGYNYKKIIITEKIEDLSRQLPRPLSEIREAINLKQSASLAPPIIDFKFTDLKRLSIKDRFSDSFDHINFDMIEATEKASNSFLIIEIELDLNNLIGHGLKSFFLRMFKIFSPARLVVFFRANENVLKTKQCLELVEFLNRFKVNLKLITNNPSNLKLWQFYSEKATSLILNLEYGLIPRSDFYNLAKSLSAKNKVFINLITTPKKFYYYYGLKEKLVLNKVGESVMLTPYEMNETQYPKDHSDILSTQTEYHFNDEFLTLKFTHTSNSKNAIHSLAINSGSTENIKFLKISTLGDLLYSNENNTYNTIGNIFNEKTTVLNDLVT